MTLAGRRVLVAFGLAATSVICGVLIRGFWLEPENVSRVDLMRAMPGLDGPVKALLFSDVDFDGVGRRERAVAEAAAAFQPDFVLVAGDLLNRIEEVRDARRLEAARSFLLSLPHGAGIFLVPGEDESVAIDPLRVGLEGVQLLSNDRRLLSVRGATIDLFGAHPRVDAASWPLGHEGSRGFVFSDHRPNEMRHRLLCVDPAVASTSGLEATFAFWTGDPFARVEVRVAWSASEGRGFRIARPEWRRDFRLYVSPSKEGAATGRIESGFVPPERRWCRARVRLDREAEHPRVRARFWVEGRAEPSDWSIDGGDASGEIDGGGSIALGGGPGSRRYADLRVTDLDGRLLFADDFSDRARTRACWSSGSVLESWIEDPRPGAARVLLTHDPDLALDVAALGGGGALVLAGHTHGGQVRLPGIGPLYLPTRLGRRFDRGLFDVSGVPLYITAGIGTSGIPFRLFDPPEVTAITLVPPPERAVSGLVLPVSHRSRRL